MKLIYNFIIVIFLLLNFTLLSAEDKIVYIDLDTVMNQSIAGKEQIELIENKRAEISKNFELKAKELKDEEIQIISQKNLLKKEDYEKKVNDFKNKIDNFKTKELYSKLKKFDYSSALFIYSENGINKNFQLASSNIPKVSLLSQKGINVKDIISYDKLFIEKKSIDEITKRLS